MKQKITLALLCLSGMMHAQDIVRLTNGTEMDIKIDHNNPESVSFERGGKVPMQFYIAKGEIDEIRFENGTVEKVPHPEMTLEEIKNKVAIQLNENAVTNDGTQKLQASFTGDRLRIAAADKKPDEGKLYDLRKIIRFEETAYRREGMAFINIWTMFVEDEKKGELVKTKLVIRLNDHEKAAILTDAIKKLVKALRQKPQE